MKEKKNSIFNEIKSFALVLVIAFLIRTLLFEPFYIPSASMEPTLLEGDYVFSTKYDYGYSKYSLSPITFDIFSGRILERSPVAGDIMIFRPPNKIDIRYIKRLIGLPGDKIQMIQGDLYINDKLVAKHYIGDYIDKNGTKFKRYKEELPNGYSHDIITLDVSEKQNTKVFEVPSGHYFFMGDNRDNSLDSRYWGYVPMDHIVGKAWFVWFSYHKDGISKGIRWKRLFHSVHSLEK